MHRIATLAAVTLGLLAPIAPAASAQPGPPSPFTITEQLDFAAGHNTFTATGPLCPSGTFVDDVQVFAPPHPVPTTGPNILIRTVYTCDDGSGTFNALKHVFVSFGAESVTNTGPFQLLGGTGAYTTLVGHGVDNGVSTGDTGVGEISGFITRP
jgi:hypothetical protein